MRNTMNELYHHGILGQRWGKRNGPPYPIEASKHSASEKRAGWQNSLDDVYASSDLIIKTNSDGSKTIPAGFKFNRIGGIEMQLNPAGSLYVSYGKLSTAVYIHNLGPNPISKLFKVKHGTHVQNISAKKNIRMASEDETCKTVLEAVKKDPDYYKTIKDSWLYSYSFSEDGITDEAFERCLKNPTSKEAKKMAYTFMATFGNSEVSDGVSKIYDAFRKKGYDAIPDLYDNWTGVSPTALILLNPDKIKMTQSHEITRDVMKDGRQYIKDYMKDHKGEIKVSEIIQ